MSIADGMHDLEIHYSDPERTYSETWTVSCSNLPREDVAQFFMSVASGLVHYRKSEAVESDDWSL